MNIYFAVLRIDRGIKRRRLGKSEFTVPSAIQKSQYIDRFVETFDQIDELQI